MRRRKPKQSRVGKTGIQRLYGADMSKLRSDRFDHDKGRCVKCGRPVIFKRGFPDSMELMHVRGKRNNGDSLEQVETGCKDCHRKFHAYGPSGEKPCKPK